MLSILYRCIWIWSKKGWFADWVSYTLTQIYWLVKWLRGTEVGRKDTLADIDDENITLHNNNHNLSTSDVISQQANYYLHKYRSYIDTLHANKTVEGSLANLRSKVELKNSVYEKSIDNISEVSKIITTYELVTILLIVGAGLGGIAEFVRNRTIGYSGFVTGGIGIIILLLFLFTGVTI